MSEPTLAWTTKVAKTDLYTFMEDKIWYKFSDQSVLFNAWSTWANASGSTYQKTAATTYAGGRAMDFRISNKFLTGWPAPNFSSGYFEYVTKWSGGCIRDYSSGMGGFCLYEDMDTAFYDCGTSGVDTNESAKTGAGNVVEICGPTAAATATAINNNANCLALVSGSTAINEEDRGGPVNIYWDRTISNPASISASKGTATHFHLASFGTGVAKSGYTSSTGTMMFYRLAVADFTTFEGAWEKSGTGTGSLQCDRGGLTGSLNKQDGRAFVASIKAKKVYPGVANKLEYFDYPKCTLETSSVYEWKCQLYLPAKTKQSAGYPHFAEPGVIIGYYTSSYIPSLKDVSYAKSTEVIQSTGAADLAKGVALVAGVLAVMF